MQTELRVPWVAIVSLPQGRTRQTDEARYLGDGRDVLLQGFHWDAHAGERDPATGVRRNWFTVVRERAAAIKAAGFTWVWLPPCSDSLAPQGYIPRRWNVLDSAYGTEGDLRAAIQALEPTKAMADLVLNHRVGIATPGADFADPPFPDNRAAIVSNDESGVGTGQPDSGELYPAGRDLDHSNPDVRATVKDYLRRLKGVGFKGWRYDLVKGFHGRFIGDYNEASNPELSVGEFFDGDVQKVTGWVDATGGKSTAFDFPTRYRLYDALQDNDYSRLRAVHEGRPVPAGLVGVNPSRSLTFLDNHDTEYRRDDEHQSNYDTTRHFAGNAVEMGYAYLMTHPGIPSVFWSHFFDWGHATRHRIEQLIRVRRSAGLHSRSSVEIKEATKGLYAAVTDGKVAMKLGPGDWWPGSGWQLAVDGERFAVWTRGR